MFTVCEALARTLGAASLHSIGRSLRQGAERPNLRHRTHVPYFERRTSLLCLSIRIHETDSPCACRNRVLGPTCHPTIITPSIGTGGVLDCPHTLLRRRSPSIIAIYCPRSRCKMVYRLVMVLQRMISNGNRNVWYVSHQPFLGHASRADLLTR